jgi:hypothetical protein
MLAVVLIKQSCAQSLALFFKLNNNFNELLNYTTLQASERKHEDVHTKYVQATQVDAVGGQSSSINNYYRTSTTAGSSNYSETIQKANY